MAAARTAWRCIAASVRRHVPCLRRLHPPGDPSCGADGQRVTHVLTHDSIGLGEDGPTHQPVEHLASLRAIQPAGSPARTTPSRSPRPGICRCEPHGGPGAALRGKTSRRSATRPRRQSGRARRVSCWEPGRRDVTLIATGSEVSIALAAEKLPPPANRAARRSAPCWELFRGAHEYRARSSPKAPRVAVEAGSSRAGQNGSASRRFRRHDRFRRIRSLRATLQHFGITAEAVATAALRCLARSAMAAGG